MAGLVFFSADDGVHGRELWVTDGTPAGTQLVRDLEVGPNNGLSNFDLYGGSDITALDDGRVILSSTIGNLWVSNGTGEGTYSLGDVPYSPEDIAKIADGVVVFAAYYSYDDAFGRELWRSDGTPGGTDLIADLYPGQHPTGGWAFSSDPQDLIALDNGTVLFSAADAAHGRELWRTDGTAAGTGLVADIAPGMGGSTPTQLYQISETSAVFSADDGTHGRELWITNGTNAQMLGDLIPGADGSDPSSFKTLPDGRVMFLGDNPIPYGFPRINYITDGTPGGTSLAVFRPGDALWEDWPDIPPPVELAVGELGYYYTDSPPVPVLILGDGRLLFRAVTHEGTEWNEWRNPSTGQIEMYLSKEVLNEELWVTDGSQAGTHFVADILEGYGSSSPQGFFPLADGRVLFLAKDSDSNYDGNGVWIGHLRSLFVTDGTEGGTQRLLSGADLLGFGVDSDNRIRFFDEGAIHFAAESDQGDGWWRTDGTPEGTKLVIPGLNGVSSYDQMLKVTGNDWLVTGRPFDSTNWQVWVTDGTPEGSKFVMETATRIKVENGLSLGDGRVLISLDRDGKGAEPWIINTGDGTMTLLRDIAPGSSGAEPMEFTLVGSFSKPGPVSLLPDEFISMESEQTEFILADHFTDPSNTGLSFEVRDLPEGLSFDPATSRISGSVSNPDVQAVTTQATDAVGGATTDSFDWTVVDTGKLLVSSSGEWGREVAGGPITSAEGSVLTIGRKDGVAQLFRVEPLDPTVPGGPTKPVATIEHGKITLEGKVFSQQVSTTKPLMEGKFTVDMAKVEVSNFEDANSNTDYRMVADLIDFTFKDINIGTDKISFRTDLAFDDGGGTGPSYNALSTKNAPLAIEFGANGLGFGASVGTERWSPDPIEFDLGAGSSIGIGFSDLGVDYEAAADAIYVNGKASVTWGGAIENGFNFIDNDSESNLTIDLFGTAQQNNYFLRGDKYLKITNAPTGWDWDVVGEIKYEDKYEGPVPSNGFLVKELVVGFDTIQDKYSGSFKANIPLLWGLDLSAGVGFVKNPDLKLDSISIGVDKINYPVGTTGLFVQGGSLALENLAAADPSAGWTYKAAITGTFGPDNDLVKSPLHGKIEGSIKETLVAKKLGYVLTGTIEIDSKVGYLLPDVVNDLATPLIDYFGVNAADITNFELIKATASTQLDLTKDRGEFNSNISLLGGVVTGSAKIINAPNATDKDARDISGSISASLIIPDAFPLVGGMTRSGNAIVKYSSDGNSANDLTAFWSQITIPLGFTESIYAFGLELKLNGETKFLGRKDIPKISSWALDEDDELVILTARWETADDTARIEVIAPDGTILDEAAIAARDDIALVDDLNTSTSRHVALRNPDAGIWDLQMATPAGLGEITYEANEMLASAVAPIASLTPDDAEHQATIVVDIAPGDTETDTIEVVIFASSETGQVAGIELARETVSADTTTLTHTFGYDTLGPGDWHIYTRTSAEGLAPVVQMHPTPLTVSGAADLATTARQATHSPTGAQVMTVTVANEGDRTSLPGILVIEVPPEMVGAPSVPVLGAEPLTVTDNEIDLPALAPGETFTVRISLPAGTEELENAIFIDAWTPGIDADPTDNALGQVLHVSQLATVDQYIDGSAGVGALIGDGGNDTLIGGTGDDFFIPGAGNDTVEGGGGISDMLGVGYTAGTQPDQALIVDLEQGLSTNDGYGTTDTLIGIEDVLGTPFGDTIHGDDLANFLIGAEGNDVIDGRGAGDLIWGGAGNDTLTGGTGADFLIYTTTATAISSDDFITLFPTLPFGDRGAIADLNSTTATDEFGDTDTISGFEHIIGSDFDDHFSGTDSENLLRGYAGDDTLVGRGGSDTLEGDEGDDQLDGGAGYDRLEGGLGDDTLIGGEGDDYAVYFNAAAGVNVDLAIGMAFDDGDGGVDTLSGIENLFGSFFDDYLVGDENDNSFTPLDGDDTVIGGDGLDRVYYGNASGAVTVNLANGTATGAEGNDTLSSIEIVQGSFFDDLIQGDDHATILNGLSGDDTIEGGGNADWLLGGAGNDHIDGGTGRDTAVFSGKQSSFTLTMSPTEITITDRKTFGEGTDRLISIEELDFDENIALFGDNPMPFDIFSGPTGLEADEFGAIIELYIAYFNRAPDAIGLNYWATDYTNGFTLHQMATSFFSQPETRATYASVLNEKFDLDIEDPAKVDAFVTAVYANVLGRTPDAPGFAYWTNELETNPGVTPAVFILSVIGGAKYPSNPTPQTAQDQAYLATKADLGAYFAVIKGMSDIADATAAMALYDGSPTSVTATQAAMDGHYLDALDADTGDFLMPLVGVIEDPFL